jgi:hypothetical protein
MSQAPFAVRGVRFGTSLGSKIEVFYTSLSTSRLESHTVRRCPLARFDRRTGKNANGHNSREFGRKIQSEQARM